jgi:hypothetical protein
VVPGWYVGQEQEAWQGCSFTNSDPDQRFRLVPFISMCLLYKNALCACYVFLLESTVMMKLDRNASLA